MSFVEQLLEEQAELTAVERFAQAFQHDTSARQRQYYQDLIPLSRPAAGEQYRFCVDLDACSGCKACVTACHSLNGLDDDETWRDVGLLVWNDAASVAAAPAFELPVLQHVTTACHHCVEPACLAGCPTQAYEKDPSTGVVRHLDDQCFGCQYCVLMCPYDVPKFNAAKGIVRKCDMCHQRLSVGEAPACVQGCPNQAISIQIVRHDAARDAARAGRFLPSAPDPRITTPTTIFVSRRTRLDAAVAADRGAESPSHAPWSLVVMLVLTQMSVGLTAVHALASSGLASGTFADSTSRAALATLAAVIGVVGVHAAVFHLGRPLLAYKAWIGWRTSWLSREVLAFGAFSACLAANAASGWTSPAPWSAALSWTTFVVGLAGVGSSAMLYAATRRPAWRLSLTAARFASTTLLLGAAGAGVMEHWRTGESSVWLTAAVPLFALCRTGLLARPSAWRPFKKTSGTGRKARPTVTNLFETPAAETIAVILGGLALPLLASPAFGIVALALLLAGELAERHRFFAFSSSSKMPGAMP